MTDDVMRYDDVEDDIVPQAHVVPTTKAIQRMEMHARALDTAHAIAKAYSWSEAVPDQYCRFTVDRKTGQQLGDRATYNATIAIMHGANLGLSPDAALENIFMIKGKPATYARLMVALVRNWIDQRIMAGRTKADETGDNIWEVEASPQKCVWAARRDGVVKYSEWTIERARAAGYTSNDLYKSIPQEMLTAKAQAETCRIVFPDVILGLSHSIEELRIEDGITVERVVPAKMRGTERLKEIAESRTESQQPPEDKEPVPEPTVATDDQIAEIAAYYKKGKVATKDALGDISTMLQREKPLHSYNELTPEEATDVLNMLSAATPTEGG